MNWGRTIRVSIAFAILVALHFTLRPVLGLRVDVDFLVIAVLLAAVRLRPGVAALLGFAIGLVADAMAPTAFGAAALAMTVVAFSAAWLKAVFFADNLALSTFFFFAGKWVFNFLYLAAERRLTGTELVMQVVLWSSLSAALTAVVGIAMLLLLRPLLETAPA